MTDLPSGRGELIVFGGSAHPELTFDVARCLGLTPGKLVVTRFPDGEIHVRIDVSVRGKDVFVIQPTCPPVNENLAELLIILDALHRASAGRITAIIPYYGYARQDKKTAGREPITARLVADMLTTAGADRVLTIDLHSPQIQGFFQLPVDHLTAVGVLARELKSLSLSEAVIVSPDAGRVKLATEYADRLALPVVIIHKRRIGPERTEAIYVVGDVKGKRPIIVDDMITTGGTIARSVKSLLDYGALPEVFVAATHAVLVGPATQNLADSAIKQVIVTDTIPLSAQKRLGKIRVASIAPLIAQAITSIHADESVSRLFE